MKTIPFCAPAALVLLLILGMAPLLRVKAEGPLTPPGAPAPTMKTLQEIWDEIAAVKAQNAALDAKLNILLDSQGIGFIEMAPVGNAGNAADTVMPNPGYGAVSYAYRIGKYEVTNAQYAAFLNAVAAADPNAIYNTNMGSNPRGGITRSGASPNFTYAVKPAMGDKPVNYVSWYDALRFCNWMHNGRPTGAQGPATTEGGSYTLTGTSSVAAGTDPTHGANGRNTGALFHLPSENEWYKAAYYQPVGQGGDVDDYWLYPTRSNGVPTVATADATGNIDNDTANIANYLQGADWNGQDGNVTTVGSGGAGSQSFYGAADMGGNVFEWNEQDFAGSRGVRGGHWGLTAQFLQSSNRVSGAGSTIESSDTGFRVAGPQ